MAKRCYNCLKEMHSYRVCEHCGFDSHRQNEDHQLPLGTVLQDQYVIGRVLGQGGFGITYRGWDNHLNIPIAIKEFYPMGVVNRSRGNTAVSCYTTVRKTFEDSKKRFLKEAQALAKLTGVPEVVRIYNYFEANNTAYIVMEYLEGSDVRQFMKKRGGRLNVAETLAIMRPVMDTLAVIHKMGMVHRDISPDNIMLMKDGRVKLLDFGAVREVRDPRPGKALTESTMAILKRGFAPAEQYMTKGDLGPWTDIYAFCATIYYCLTGMLPPEPQQLVLEGKGMDWSRIPGLLPQQRDALTKGTALRTQERTRSMRELCVGLYGGNTVTAHYDPNNQEIPATAPVTWPGPEHFSGMISHIAGEKLRLDLDNENKWDDDEWDDHDNSDTWRKKQTPQDLKKIHTILLAAAVAVFFGQYFLWHDKFWSILSNTEGDSFYELLLNGQTLLTIGTLLCTWLRRRDLGLGRNSAMLKNASEICRILLIVLAVVAWRSPSAVLTFADHPNWLSFTTLITLGNAALVMLSLWGEGESAGGRIEYSGICVVINAVFAVEYLVFMGKIEDGSAVLLSGTGILLACALAIVSMLHIEKDCGQPLEKKSEQLLWKIQPVLFLIIILVCRMMYISAFIGNATRHFFTLFIF